MLSNRVAIITGGARGIGKGIALKFADEGCSIVIADVLVNEAGKTVEQISQKGREAIFVQCDVSKSRQVQDLVDQTINRFGKVDILVNNAGIAGAVKSIVDVSEEEWDRLLAINLKGVFLCCKAVVPYMKKKGYGKIINISSSAAVAPPAPVIHYSASKTGVLGLTRDLALELAPLNICVNAILPGVIPTDIYDDLQVFPPGVKKEDAFAEMGKMFAPMQRLGTPEDIAGAALFLASDLSAYVTGDRIIVAGGYPLKQFFK
jgi:NAD(P)-dependent dehydrogenase (short-subunit alcohol dehydrogenase family)